MFEKLYITLHTVTVNVTYNVTYKCIQCRHFTQYSVTAACLCIPEGFIHCEKNLVKYSLVGIRTQYRIFFNELIICIHSFEKFSQLAN